MKKSPFAHPKSTVHSQRLALESRLVFDGAMIATVTEVQADSVDNKPISDNPNAAAATSEPPVDFFIDKTPPAVDYQPTVDSTDNQPAFAVESTQTVSPVSGVSGDYATTLIVVDPRADNAAALYSNPPINTQVIILDAARDGFQQVSELLQGRHDVTELNVLPWINGNTQWLGNKTLASTLEPTVSNELMTWGDGFADNANIVFHGTDNLSTSWLNHIDALTGADTSWSPEIGNLVNNSAHALFVLADTSFNDTITLNTAEKMVQEHLSTWFQKDDYLSQVAIPFSANANTPEWTANALALRDSIVNGSYTIRLEVRSAAELNGVLGAYSATGTNNQPTIYLNADWLSTATPDAIQSVLLEELGHSFDNRLNGGVDSQGDEGQAFVGLLLYNDANLNVVLQQDDHGVVNVDGQTVAIEAAAPYNVAQTFFVPMREADIKTSLAKINTAVGTQIQSIISIVSTDNSTVIVYDHWEDGYEIDIKNPLQSTTEIWGDGIGLLPDGTPDTVGLSLGQVITLNNTVDLAQVGSLTPTNHGAKPYYDGRDKIGATKAIAVTRAGWGVTPGTVLAGAVNLYDAGNAGTSYTIPIGENVITNTAAPLDTANRLFEYTSLHIIATENNTKVTIDLDGASGASIPFTVTLNQGETYLVNGGVKAGATVVSADSLGSLTNKPIEVYAIAGDVGSAYENRWVAITPRTQWASSYYAPVSTTLAADPAYVFLYNPNATAIDVTWDTQTVSGQHVIVAPNESKYVLMPASAAHFYTANKDKFFAISTIDSDPTDNQTHDWSYSLVPESYLTDKFVVAWGPGWNNTGGGAAPAGTVNGSPVWVTAPTATTIYIDYAGDGWNAGQGDITYNLKALESYRISDPDKDQSGLTVYTTDGTLITAAWGEDPSVAGAGNPYLDMGTTVMPFPSYVFNKVSREAAPVQDSTGKTDGDTLMELGEQVEYSITVTNRAVIDLFNINLKDALTPIGSATYVSGSAVVTVYDSDGVIVYTANIANGVATSFPLDALNGGYTITDTDPNTAGTQGLQRGYQAEIKYRVQVQSSISKSVADANFIISNTVAMTADASGGTPGDVVKSFTNKTQLTVPFTDGEVFFYDSTFANLATSYVQGTPLGLQVTDADQNKNTALAETLNVIVTNTSTGEIETVSLLETGLNTGIFRKTLATVAGAGAGANNDGSLRMANAQALPIKVEYTDPTSGTFADNPANPSIIPTTYVGGNPNIKTATVAAVLPTQSDGLLAIYSDSGYSALKTSYQEGDTLYLRVTDMDQNTNTGSVDHITVTITNSTTGELENVTLTETGVNTGDFRGTLTTANNSAINANNSGSLYTVMGNVIQADYTDAIFGANFDNPLHIGIAIGDDNNINTGLANRVTATVTKTKVLYLSATGDLDRIDPVSTADGTTSTTAAINPAAGVTITDNFDSGLIYTGGSGWSSGWVETSNTGTSVLAADTAGSSPTTGTIQVVAGGATGSTNMLKFGGSLNAGTGTYTGIIERAFTTLTSNATLSFDYNNVGMENTGTAPAIDYLLIDGFNGSTWYSIATINPTATAAYTPPNSNFATFPAADDGVTVTKGATVTAANSVLSGTSKIRFTYVANRVATDEFNIDNVSITVAGAATPATFTQAIPMASAFSMPTGGQIKVVTYISALTGTPTGANIQANLTYGAGNTVIANLSSPVYDNIAGTLTWTGTLASNINIATGDAVKLVVTNNQAGVSFQVDYDSSTKQSRIEFPTTTVIKIVDVDNNAGNGIQEIGFYDKSFANGGSLIASDSISAGGIVYVRVRVSDPFGDYDINGLNLTIDEALGTGGDLSIALTNANLVNVAGDGSAFKTYEYAWQTINNTGLYNIGAIAQEGYETITATAISSFTITALDLGTPSTTMFITALGGVDAGTQYVVGANAYIRVTDLDENTNSSAVETVIATVNGLNYLLTETGANTGIFEALAYTGLPAGTVLTASYVDNDDATDTSGDTISVPVPGNIAPTLDLDTTDNGTVNNTAIFNEGGASVAFVKDVAGTPITDDGTAIAYLTISIPTIKITDGAAEQLLINGATGGGTIALNFATGAGVNITGVGGVTYAVALTDNGTTKTLSFSKSGGGNLTIAQAETLLEALSYNNTSQNPTDANRVFTAVVNDGFAGTPLDSNTATFTVDVNPVNDPPVLDLDGSTAGYNYSTSFTEGVSSNVPIVNTNDSITDADSTNIISARIILTNPLDGALESLSINGVLLGGIIASSYDSSTGVITLTGSATLANYQAALQQIVYNNSSKNPNSTPRTIDIVVNDGSDDSNITTTTINVVPVNDQPVITPAVTPTTYTENAVATVVDNTVTITDVDDTQMSGGTVSITGNFLAGDVLAITNTGNITGSYVAATGILTLSGTDTIANYQAVLRSLTYLNSTDDPTDNITKTTRTLTYSLTDANSNAVGAATSIAVTKTISITPLQDAPVLTGGGTLTYTEQAPAAVIDATVTVSSDADDTLMSGATITLSAGYTAGDSLNFTAQNGITISTNNAGVLVLTGNATLANYTAALRSITFNSTSDTPTSISTSRTVTWQVRDANSDLAGIASSNTVTSTINITPVNNAPTLTGVGSANYTENGAAVTLFAGITVADVDDANIASATISIGGFVSGDTLNFINQNGITGSYNSGTGILSLTGTATKAQYQAALQSITFNSSSDDPTVNTTAASRTVSWTVTDANANLAGAATSVAVTSTINFTAVNDVPVVAGLSPVAFTENGTAVVVGSTLNLTDPDDTQLTGATLRITGNYTSGDILNFTNQLGITGSYAAGVLTLSGTTTLANYQTAMRTISFITASDDPTVNGTANTRTLSWQVTDANSDAVGAANSAVVTNTLTVTPLTDNPVVTATVAALTYTEGDGVKAIDNNLTLSDVDDTQLTGASIVIGTGRLPSDVLSVAGTPLGSVIAGTNITVVSYTAATGTLVLSGTDSIANYQSVLRTVSLQNPTDDPTNDTLNTSRVVTFTVTDANSDSAGVGTGSSIRTITVIPTQDAPVLTGGGTLTYTEQAPAAVIDATVTVSSDADDTLMSGATITLSAGYTAGDSLNFTAQNGITISTNNAGVLVLTGNATLANYTAALRSITFNSTSDTPTSISTSRTVTWQVRDANSDLAGIASSNTVTSTINITPVNNAPTLTGVGSANYTENGAAVTLFAGITVADVDDANIASATISIGGFVSGDTLNFINQNGITGSYNSGTGILSLTGTATKAQYQAALQSITFNSSSDDPTVNTTAASRTVSWTVTDANANLAGAATSVAVTSTINFTAVNDVPVVAGLSPVAFTENGTAVVVGSTLNLTDPDDTQLTGATLRITGNYTSGDILNFTNQLGITGSYAAGVLTLSGTTTLANYQTAMRTISFITASDDPTVNGTANTRTLSWQVTDANSDAVGAANSAVVTNTLTVTPLTDNPVVTATVAALTYTEGDGVKAIDNNLTLSDVDDTQLTGASIVIGTGRLPSDVLSVAGTPLGSVIAGTNITVVSYTAATGTLVLSGTDSIANYQSVLRTVSLQNPTDDPTNDTLNTSRVVTFTVTDANSDSAGVGTGSSIRTITVIPTQDAPVLTGGGTLTYTEQAPAAVIDATVTVSSDADDTLMSGATITLSAGYTAGDSLNFTAQNGITISTNNAGVLVLTGNATLANYTAALRSITFNSTSDTPTSISTSRTVTWQVRDANSDLAGIASSNTVTSTINITPVNNAPTLTGVGSANYTENGAAVTLFAGITVADVDDANIASATISIGGFVSGDTLNFINQNGITGSYNSGTGILSLTGTATKAQYQAALQSITFNSSSDDPTVNTTAASRTVSWTVTDANANLAGAATSVAVTSTINFTAVNDVPVVAGLSPVAFTENGTAVVVGSTLNLTDPDDTQLTGATLRITGNYTSGDILNFTNQLGITGSYAAGVLTLSGTTTLANYQTAMRTISFITASDDPTVNGTANTRTLSWQVTDANSDAVGAANSAVVTNTLTVTPLTDNPVVTATVAALTYTEGDGVKAIDNNLTLSDVDDTQLTGASIVIGTGRLPSDVLSVAGTPLGSVIAGTNITVVSYTAATGTLVLSGTDSIANYQSVLRTVSLQNPTDDPTNDTLNTSRVVTFTVTDANSDSAGVGTGSSIRTITVIPTQDAPVLTGGGTLTYTEQAPAAVIDATVTVSSDADDTLMSGATITLSAGYTAGDSLNFTAQNGITISTNNAGVLVLTGNATLANYTAALRSITFNSTSDTPTSISTSRTVTWQVRDANSDLAGIASSNTVTSTINILAINDIPVLTALGNTVNFIEVGTAVVLNNAVTVADVDLSPLSGGVGNYSGTTLTLVRSTGTNAEDVFSSTGTLAALTQGGNITVGVTTIGIVTTNSAGTLVLTFNANATTALVNSALQQIAYRNNSSTPQASVQINWLFNDQNPNVTGGGIVGTGQDQGGGGVLTASGSTTMTIDRLPTANADTNSMTENALNVAGNVITGTTTADDQGDPATTVTGVASGTQASTSGSVNTPIAGSYGSLTLNSTGAYTYTLDNTNPLVNKLLTGQSLTETYSYTITDADGDTSTTTLKITINGTTDGAATVVPVDGNGGLTGQADVFEKGLVAPTDNSQTTTGTLTVTAPDGMASVTIGGTTFMVAQLAAFSVGTPSAGINTGEGTLKVTGFSISTGAASAPTTGTLSYTYTLNATQPHTGGAAVTESVDTITIVVTDATTAANTSTGTLTVRIVDDTPTANADTNSITEDTATTSGNVFSGSSPDIADRLGADVTATPVTGVAFGTLGSTSGNINTPVAGNYGSLTLNADGSYTYTLDNTNSLVNKLLTGDTLLETYSYTITDADGDTSTTTLKITINGHTDNIPSIVPDDMNGAITTGHVSVQESGLTSGTDTSETNTGTLTLSALDGLAGIKIAGTPITLAQLNNLGTTPITVTTPKGTITLTGYNSTASVGGVSTAGTLDYSYTLVQVQNTPAATENTDDIPLSITNAGGNTITNNLSVQIVDDTPTANADTNSVNEGKTAAATTTSGNVFSGSSPDVADRIGADVIATPITGVAFGMQPSTSGNVNTPVAGTYGNLTLNAAGGYTYTLDNTNPAVNALLTGETLSETYSYTITDADGDTSTTTLKITIIGITDSTPEITAIDGNGIETGQATVFEKGLVTPSDKSQTTTGTIAVATPDGMASVTIGGTTFTVAQLATFSVGSPSASINTGEGTLIVTGFNIVAGPNIAPTAGTLTYRYTLNAAQAHTGGNTVTESTDRITLVVTDSSSLGNTATSTLTVRIVDDTPTAKADTNSVIEGTTTAATTTQGNVFGAIGATAGDVADRIGVDTTATPVTGVSFAGSIKTVGSPFNTAYGSLTLNANGSYIYTLDNTNTAVNALGLGQTLSETFSYTITDADGDTSTTTLTITVNGRNDAPIAVNDIQIGITGQPVIINVLGNAHDPENNINPATVKIVGTARAGDSLEVAGQGIWSVNPLTGAITFTPFAGFTADPTPISYTVTDKTGLTSNPATVTVDYPQTPPLAVDNTVTAVTGKPVTITVLDNTRDPENDINPATLHIAGTANAGDSLEVAGQGIWSINPLTGTITFTPNLGFTGNPTPISYTVTDNTGLTSNAARVTVNYPPVIITDIGTSGSLIMLSNPDTSSKYNEQEKKAILESKFKPDNTLPPARLSLYVPIRHYVIFLTGSLRNQLVLELERYSFNIPRWMFRHTDPNEQLEFEAAHPDGSSLPAWLVFNPKTLKFSGVTPKGAHDERVMVTARDTYGNEVHATFNVHVNKERMRSGVHHKVFEKPRAVGKAGLSEQIHAMGKLNKLQESRALLDGFKSVVR